MKKLTTSMLALALAAGLFSATAFAKGGTPQNHHCMKDGAAMPDKTKKECKKAGGTWEKDAPAAKADDAAKPAGEAEKAPAAK